MFGSYAVYEITWPLGCSPFGASSGEQNAVSLGTQLKGILQGLEHHGGGERRYHDAVLSILPLGMLSGRNHLPDCQGTVWGMHLEWSRTEPENKLSV